MWPRGAQIGGVKTRLLLCNCYRSEFSEGGTGQRVNVRRRAGAASVYVTARFDNLVEPCRRTLLMARSALPDGEDLDDDLRFDFAALSIEKNPHLDPLLIIVAAFGEGKCARGGDTSRHGVERIYGEQWPINM